MVDSFSIFKTFKNYIKSDFVKDEKISIEWYLNTLLEYLIKIDNNLSKNDFELLYSELENDINKSINSFDFNLLSSILDKIKYAKNRKDIFEKSEKDLEDIILNDKIQLVIEYTRIPCQLYFCSKKCTFQWRKY